MNENYQLLRNQLKKKAKDQQWTDILQWTKNGRTLRELEILNLMGEQINQIPSQINCLSNLKFLFLSKNNIEKIQNISQLINLVRLHIDRNKIQFVEGLNTLSLLEQLQLQKNFICRFIGLRLPKEMTNQVKSLLVINLSFNEMSSIQSILLISVPSLTEINLNDNKICNVWSIRRMNCPYLQKIHLNNNKITTSNSQVQIKKFIFVYTGTICIKINSIVQLRNQLNYNPLFPLSYSQKKQF